MPEPCHITNCVRAKGHAGAHTAAPSARTLDWDENTVPLLAAARTLRDLDFETPWYADLRDDEAT